MVNVNIEFLPYWTQQFSKIYSRIFKSLPSLQHSVKSGGRQQKNRRRHRHKQLIQCLVVFYNEIHYWVYKDSYWLHFKHIHHHFNGALYMYITAPPVNYSILCIVTIVHMVAFVNLLLKKMVVMVVVGRFAS